MDTTRKIVLITGAAQGLGKEMARTLIEQGHYVIILDIQESDVVHNSYGHMTIDYRQVDLAEFAAVDRVIDEILEKYGRIDVLVNNAAVKLFKHFSEFEEWELDRYMSVNYMAPIMLIRKIYPYMRRKAYGRIINISSFSAFSGYSLGSMYCSTKCALNAFTESVGHEYRAAENVTLNVICPDSFSTLDGRRKSAYSYIVNSVNETITDIIRSKRNGEIIVIARKKTILLNTLYELKKRLWWLLGR
jgi:NAD(P)-dependent dehydrogenase (short-subunit alcohol dehydrogenase family)